MHSCSFEINIIYAWKFFENDIWCIDFNLNSCIQVQITQINTCKIPLCYYIVTVDFINYTGEWLSVHLIVQEKIGHQLSETDNSQWIKIS